MVKEEKRSKELIAEKKAEIAYGVQLRISNEKQNYIKNLINGRYYLARCNMISDQITNKKILETIDGCPKSEEFMRTEYALMKMQAITSMRNAHFSKRDLVNDFKLSAKEIHAIEEDYYDGKIIREEYDEGYKKKTKAEFIASSKD